MNTPNEENLQENANQQCRSKTGFMRKLKMKLRMKRGGWWKRKKLNKLSAKLDLESTQREALEEVFAELHALKTSAFESRKSVGAGLAAAIQGEAFDKELAREALQQPIDNIQTKMDATLASFAKWFNELNQSQQQQLREMLENRFRHSAASSN